MKKIFTILTLLIVVVYAGDELEWIDTQIEAIKPKREAVNIVGISDPFVFLNRPKSDGSKQGVAKPVEPPKPPKVYTLSMVMNEKALINDAWYAEGDKIDQYRVIAISKSGATLHSKDSTKALTTATTNKIKFKNR